MLRALDAFVVNPTLSFFKGDGDAQLANPVETDDAPTPPFPPERTPTPPVPISSSPESQARPHPHQRHPRSPYTRPTAISDEETRLLPDYDIPPDATIIPDPIAWAYNEQPIMKPGSKSSYGPLNTIDRPTRSTPKITYGAKRPRPEGWTDGQLDFLNKMDRDGEDSPATKRRKMQQANVIDIEDDASPSSIRSPLSVTSKSHRSTDRERGPKPSSFMQTAQFMEPYRKKSRRPDVSTDIGHRRASFAMSADRGHSFQGTDTDHAIELEGDNDSTLRTDTANSDQLSRYFHHYSSDDELQAESPPTVSKHFANRHTDGASCAKNVMETGAKNEGTVQAAKGSIMGKLLRSQHVVDSSEDNDELAEDFVPTSTIRNIKNGSRPHVPTTTTRRKMPITLEHGWPLLFGRNPEVEGHGPGLFLRRRANSTLFDLQRDDHVGQGKIDATLDMRKINFARFDKALRIRLEGAVSQGSKYLFDLQFEDKGDFQVFLDMFVEPACPDNRVVLKESDWMERVFKGPISRNSNAHPPSAPGVTRSCDAQGRPQSSHRRPRPKALLIDQLNPNRGNSDVQEVSKTTRYTRPLTQSRIAPHDRPVRATRNSQPVHTVDLEANPKLDEEPIKYSEEHGLGPRWSKPLQYGSGRRRALVDFDDLLRLDEGQYLNDQLVDFYMIYLFEQAKIPPNTVYFFNSHFYTSLTQPVPGQKGRINYGRVARWTKEEDIFNYDYIVVPVCEATHWYLAIICNVSNISRKPALGGADSSSPAPTSSAKVEDDQKLASVAAQKSTAVQVLTVPTEHDSLDTSNTQPAEDPNLFDEEAQWQSTQALNNTNRDKDLPPATQRDSETRDSSAEVARLGNLTLEDKIPKGILGDVLSSPPSTKKKDKRRSIRNGKKYPPDEPIVIILDSLGLSHPNTVRALKDYILEEGRAKRSMDALITQNVFYPREAHIPMQPNTTDCGVYLLGYLQKFLNDPRNFVTSVLAREMDPKEDWPDMRAPDIRHAMREILMALAEQQRVVKKKKRPATNSQHVPEGPKPWIASSALVAPSTDALSPPANSVDEMSRTAPLPSPKGNNLVTGGQKTRLESPSQQPPMTNLAIDENSSTTQLRASMKNDPAPEGQSPRLASPTRLVPSAAAAHPPISSTAESEPKDAPRRSSPKVLVPMRSPEKLKRALDDSMSHDEAQTSGRAVDDEPASEESSPKRLKMANGSKSTPRLSTSPARTRQSPRTKTDTHALLEGSSPYTSGTKSSQPTPRRSPRARGSSVNPIEIDDSQESVGQNSPTSVRSRGPPKRSAIEEMTESIVRHHPAKAPSRVTTRPPRTMEQQSPKTSRSGQLSLAASMREHRKQRSENPRRTTAMSPRESASQRPPATSRHRQPSVEEIPSTAGRQQFLVGLGRARRHDRDSPEAQDSEQVRDFWVIKPSRPPPRRRGSIVPESPPLPLLEGFPTEFGMGDEMEDRDEEMILKHSRKSE